MARSQSLILVTEDVGFGRLIFQKQLAPPVGVILIALDPMIRSERQALLMKRAPLHRRHVSPLSEVKK